MEEAGREKETETERHERRPKQTERYNDLYPN